MDKLVNRNNYGEKKQERKRIFIKLWRICFATIKIECVLVNIFWIQAREDIINEMKVGGMRHMTNKEQRLWSPEQTKTYKSEREKIVQKGYCRGV